MQNLTTSTKEEYKADIRSVYDVGIHKSEEFGSIRTVTINGEPWFVAKDVCVALKHTNPTVAMQMLEEDERTKLSLGRAGETNFINESGLYTLIIKSNLPKAREFRKWVTSEVLPTIRKTGGYVSNEDLFIETYLPFADENTKVLFSQTLQVIRIQNETIKKQSEEIMHKEDVIIGLVENIDLATKRQRITQIVRHCKNKNYQERYRLLYSEFEKKYHCNLSYRLENDVLKPKARNTMDYIDRGMNMIPQLYEIACKLFENDVETLKTEWESVVA